MTDPSPPPPPPPSPPPSRPRPRGLVVLAAVAILAVVVGIVMVVRDRLDRGTVAGEASSSSSSSGVDPLDVLDERQAELVGRAVADPACAAAQEPGPAAAVGRVDLLVLRLDGTCLTTTTEQVAPADVAARREELADDPAVVAAGVAPPVQPDAPVRVAQPREDDRRDAQWGLDALGVPVGSADLPWPDGEGAVVAVLDSGIAPHPDLGDAVVGRRTFSGEDRGDLDPLGHGTHVAGIVAARRGNGGIVGVAPAASVLDVPVHLGDVNDGADPWTGLVWAVNSGATVANMSFGAPLAAYEEPSADGALEIVAAAVLFAHRHDVVLVSSAGNCGPDPSGFETGADGLVDGCDEVNQRDVPAMLDGVVAVGAVRPDDDDLVRLSGISTRNDDVDLVAPGYDNESTYAQDPDDEERRPDADVDWDDAYASIGATSQAAPHVAAAVAVARSQYPAATADQVVDALLSSAAADRLRPDDRSDVGAGAGLVDVTGLLDDVRTALTSSPDEVADRTRLAFVRDDMLYAYDGSVAHPVRRAGPDSPVTWVAWSDDRERLVGLAGSTLFSWAGEGSRPVEVPYQFPCEACGPSLAYVGDRVVSLDVDGTLTEHAADTLEQLGSKAVAFPPDAVGTKVLYGSVGDRLLVHESGGAHASERLWLVDPGSREAVASHDVAGSVQGGVAVDASGSQVALVAGYSSCDPSNQLLVLDGSDLSEVASPSTPAGMVPDELFFNGDVLYATMSTADGGSSCSGPMAGTGGVWRLDGDSWSEVRSSPLANTRPLDEGWFVVATDGRASIQPGTASASESDLGTVEWEIWATPPSSETPLDVDPSSEPEPETSPTVEDAVARFEEFAHAYGSRDVATACAIGGPAIESGGGGDLSCEEAARVGMDLASAEQMAALRELEIDPSTVRQTAPDRVEIPPAPPLSDDPANDPPTVLEHDGTDWFVVD